MKIILSIKPRHVENILSGAKKYEFRKQIPIQPVDKVIIYSSYPDKKFTAEFSLIKIIKGSPSEVWEATKEKSGITKDFYDDYFAGKDKAFGLKIDNLNIYDAPIIPAADFVAPQSFKYI